MPASASRSISSGTTYLVAARTSTSGPASSRTSARLRRTTSGSMSRIGSAIEPDHAALAARAAAVAPVGEEELRVAARAQVARFDAVDAGGAELAAGDLGQVEHVPLRDPLAEPGEGVQHVEADFIATG